MIIIKNQTLLRAVNYMKNKINYLQIYGDSFEFLLNKRSILNYQISSGWVESIQTEKSIPILYLPWWDSYNKCIACDQILEFNSDCQKWCPHCIIIYTGCRYCLTTNIIF